MKSRNIFLPLCILSPQLWVGGIALDALAQQPQQEAVKDHLEYCVGQLVMPVAQAEAIGNVMHQQDLSQAQKLEQVGQILNPEQKQQLLNCMEQPMPAHS